MPDESRTWSRRAVVVTLLTAAGGLALALRRTAGRGPAASAAEAWLRLEPDGTLRVVLGVSDLGQGAVTALARLVADELGASWEHTRAESAPADPAFANPLMGRQRTAWSASVRGWWDPLADAAADLREILIAAAAARWGVPAAECVAEAHEVRHPGSGRAIGFGAAAALPAAPPATRPAARRTRAPLPDTDPPRLDVPPKLTGAATYTADLRPDGLRFGAMAAGPPLDDASREALRALPGVLDIVELADRAGVIARDSWASLRALALLLARAEAPPDAGTAAGTAAGPTRPVGGMTMIDAGRFTFAFETAYVAHAPLETFSCVAAVGPARCDVWLPAQDQTTAREVAAAASGLPPDAVRVHTPVVGGAFGARVYLERIADAVALARAAGGPVQLVTSREQEFLTGRARPATRHEVTIDVDDDGWPRRWRHRIDGGDPDALPATPYRLRGLRIEARPRRHALATGIWRAVEHGPFAFAVEGALDELARRAGRDPIAYRQQLLPADGRAHRLLAQVARSAAWRAPLAPGRARGVAMHEMTGTVVAHVVEVELMPDGSLRVPRVHAFVDAGRVAHADGLRSQVEGSVVMGLGTVLREALHPAALGPRERNFDRYRPVRLAEAPRVSVELCPSGAPPGGGGEPALPPLAPATANALTALTGRRPYALPFPPQG